MCRRKRGREEGMQPDSQQEPQATIIQGLSTWKGNGGEPQCPLALACCHMYTHGQAAQTHLAPNWACRKYTQDLFHTAHGDFRGGRGWAKYERTHLKQLYCFYFERSASFSGEYRDNNKKNEG